MRVFHFLSYHNAVPITITLLLVGGSATFAATNPEAIYDTQERVISVDNTYLVRKDLTAYSPGITITNVLEDESYYYVDFKFSTIDVEDAVWQDVTRSETMRVSKVDLGPYRDLGIYVTQQLHNIVAREDVRLKETQKEEGKHESQKVIAIAYSGLIGKFLDETTTVLPGYTPVVQPPQPPEEVVAAAGAPSGSSGAGSNETSQTPVQQPAPSNNGGILQILGNNPARIEIGTRYADLGAVITNPSIAQKAGLISLFLNAQPTDAISIDTSAPATYTVRYVATAEGQSWSAERTVIVYNPNPITLTPEPPPTESPAATTESAGSTASSTTQ